MQLTDTRAMDLLDKASNLFGSLRPTERARLFAVIDTPSSETWDDAYSIILDGSSWLTLWQALLRFTDYSVTSKPCDGPWPVVPTREQIVEALTAALG